MIRVVYGYRFVLSLLILVGLPAATVYAEAGIDWGSSYMKVEFAPENGAVPALDCFGYENRLGAGDACESFTPGAHQNCVWESLAELGYSDEDTAPDITTCYQQAGDYQITIQLTDYAGNNGSPLVDTFTVKAGSPDPDQSTFEDPTTTGCSGLSLAANGVDVCTLNLSIRDKYGNPVTQLQGETGAVYSDAEFPSDANSGTLDFRSGTKVNGNFLPNNSAAPLSFTIGTDDAVTTAFDVTNWAPSIKTIGEVLGINEPFGYDFKFILPTVTDLGVIDPGNTITFEFNQYAPQIGFAPWGSVLLDLNIVPKQYTLDVQTPFVITRNLLAPFVAGPNNPFNVLLTVHNLHPTLRLEKIADGSDFTTAPELVSAPEEQIPTVLRVNGNNAQTGGDIAFSSVVSYEIVDGGTQTIAYPSGSLGSGLVGSDQSDGHTEDEIGTTLIGVSVEGKILGSKDAVVINDPSTFNGVQISEGDSLSDVRREVFENATRITRSLETKVPNVVNNVIAFDPTWFDDENVAYVLNNDVAITNSGSTLNMPAGRNTLVIQNGNLIIEDDLNYANNLDSFGFILINDSVVKEPETGNVFVQDDVRQIVGTYFAEGGVMSLPSSIIVTDNDDAEVAFSDNGDATNELQLIIEGTMLTHNTLGGGIYQVTSDNYITPWESTPGSTAPEEARAVKYDLHFMRTYSPEYDAGGNQTNFNECYPGAAPCYPNSAATVIRYDGRAVKTAPPGFEGASFFAR